MQNYTFSKLQAISLPKWLVDCLILGKLWIFRLVLGSPDPDLMHSLGCVHTAHVLVFKNSWMECKGIEENVGIWRRVLQVELFLTWHTVLKTQGLWWKMEENVSHKAGDTMYERETDFRGHLSLTLWQTGGWRLTRLTLNLSVFLSLSFSHSSSLGHSRAQMCAELPCVPFRSAALTLLISYLSDIFCQSTMWLWDSNSHRGWMCQD